MQRIGVTIVAGFLGSGKTTLVRRVVADTILGPRIAVIVNELGALGLDEDLIASSRSTRTMQIQQLVSGCVCCTLKGALADALRELATGAGGAAVEHVLIETSGAARVSEVALAVQMVAIDAPIRAEAVVTVVDARNAEGSLAEHGELFIDQIRRADLVLLNKCDLVPAGPARDSLLALLHPLAPTAQWLCTEHADLSPELLVGMGLLAGEATEPTDFSSRKPDFQAIEKPAFQTRADPHPPLAASAHGFSSMTLPVPGRIDRDGLELWLEELSLSVFRIKGVVDVNDGTTVLVQAVGDQIDIDSIDESSSLRQAGRRLIFIGVSLDRDALAAGLAELTHLPPVLQ